MDPIFASNARGPAVPVAGESRSLGEMFRLRAQRSAEAPASYEKREGKWRGHTWRDLYDRSRRVARGLVDLGIARGEAVAILGPTSVDWGHFDLGGQLCGLVTVGVYPHQSPEQLRYLLEHSESRVIFVDGADELRNVLEAARGVETLRAIVPWTEDLATRHSADDPRVIPPSRFGGEPLDEASVGALLEAVDPQDTAIIVYTSGTTGPPKGAMLSHANLMSLLRSPELQFMDSTDDLLLSFLPMAHVAERNLAFYGRINAGVASAYASSVGAVLSEIQEVAPTIFGSVPRLFEKAYSKIRGDVARKPALVRKLFAWAEGVGRRRARLVLAGKSVPTSLAMQYALADRLVFGKIRAVFGGRVRAFITGAAPIAFEILEFFWAAGLPVYEVYGMTEATVATHTNRPEATRLGSVGRCIAPMECRIAQDGEVLLRGPFVFKGYFKNPEATAETVVDGWLQTGDVGELDPEGFLRITDRKKHLIITAGGKNISPANIERAIKSSSPLISQIHVHGDRRAYISALIAPSPLETLEWGAEHGILGQDELERRRAELMANPSGRTAALNAAMARVVQEPRFQKAFLEPVRRGNRNLSRVEQVRRFWVLDRDFSQEEDELTPTMKLKRKVLERKFAPQFDRLYAEESFGFQAEPPIG